MPVPELECKWQCQCASPAGCARPGDCRCQCRQRRLPRSLIVRVSPGLHWLASSTPSRSCVQACSMPVVAGPRGFGPGAGRGSEPQASRCFWCQWLVGARSRGPTSKVQVALRFCFIAQICAQPRSRPLPRSSPPGGPSVGPLADRRKVGPRWNGGPGRSTGRRVATRPYARLQLSGSHPSYQLEGPLYK